jgi:hypothetical protein
MLRKVLVRYWNLPEGLKPLGRDFEFVCNSLVIK